jgi:hypothetical protein
MGGSMKKMIISMIVALTTMHSFVHAQINSNSSVQATSKGIPIDIKQNDNTATYRLFPTQNMWTFIKLNTRNGQMWQVQWDIKGNNRFETNLNSVPLVAKGEEANDRFTLYSTQNIYTFILLDELDGKIWQVQWSIDANNRGILPF